MFFVLVAFEEGVEDQSWIRKRVLWKAVLGGHRASVGRARFAHGGEQGVVVGPIGGTESVFHGILFRCLIGERSLYWWEAEVGARRVWKILVDWLWSWVSVKLCRLVNVSNTHVKRWHPLAASAK